MKLAIQISKGLLYYIKHYNSNLSENKLTPGDLGHVLEEVLDVSAQWYLFGLQLNLSIGTLDRIRAQFSDPRDQLLEMLKTWLNTSDCTSWKILTDALKSRSVGACQLAGLLETKYCRVEVDSGTYNSESRPGTTPPRVSEPTPQPVKTDMQEGR